jgi:hypothetical protein
MDAMIYEFRTDAGDILEKQFTSDEVPDIGTSIYIEGQLCQRIISVHSDATLPSKPGDPLDKTLNEYPKLSSALPTRCEGAEADPKTGKPIIKSKAHESELCRRYGVVPARDAYDNRSYSGGLGYGR